jgi:hypothetical protein
MIWISSGSSRSFRRYLYPSTAPMRTLARLHKAFNVPVTAIVKTRGNPKNAINIRDVIIEKHELPVPFNIAVLCVVERNANASKLFPSLPSKWAQEGASSLFSITLE